MSWRRTSAVELIADDRSAMQRRFDALALCGHIGRQRPQWAGERGQKLFDETADLMLPWELE